MRKLKALTPQEHQMLTEVMSTASFMGKHVNIVYSLMNKLQSAEEVEGEGAGEE